MDENCRQRIMSEEYANFMFGIDEELDEIAQRYDGCYDLINRNIAVMYIPVDRVPSDFIHLYGYSVYPNAYGLMDIAALEASNITRIRNIPRLDMRGSGILVGIIDTGIDYTHEAFINEDGTSKVYSIWDQTIINNERIPEGFSFGAVYKKEEINQALASDDPFIIVPSNDEDGHGTFLAGIVAGNQKDSENFAGIVPEAELLIVKVKQAKQFTRDFWKIPEGPVCFQEDDLILATRYLIETAQKAKRPLSIIIGIGTSQGGHDERGALSGYLSSIAATNGVAISIAAGNEGNVRHHYNGFVGGTAEFDNVELNVAANVSGFSMEFWGRTPVAFSIDITSPTGEYIPRILARLNQTREVGFIFTPTRIQIDYQLVEAESGDQLILVRFTAPSPGIWKFRVYTSGNLSLNYQVWLPISNFLDGQTYFINASPDYTLTSPGNVIIPIVVTAYNHVDDSLYINASRGYTRTEEIAPVVAAPGVGLVGPGENNTYIIASGTSLAAAHVGGINAMILEWGILKGNYPNISTVQIKNLLIRGARRSPQITYPNRQWGYGIVDVLGMYNSLRSVKRKSNQFLV